MASVLTALMALVLTAGLRFALGAGSARGHRRGEADPGARALAIAFQQSVVAQVLTAADGRVVVASRTLAERLGVPAGALGGHPWSDWIAAGDRPRLAEALTQLHAGQVPRVALTLRLQGATAGTPSRLSLALVPDGDRPPLVLHQIVDVPPDPAAELVAGPQDEAWYRRIVETASEGIWALDARGVTTFANQRLAAMLGLPLKALLGRSVFDFMDESARAEAERLLERRRHGIVESHEFRFRDAAGRAVHTLLSTTPLADPGGGYAGALALVTDITARVRAEQAARAAADRLENLTRNLDGGWVYRVSQVPGGPMRIDWISDSIERILGVSAEAAVADADVILRRILPEDDARRRAQMAASDRDLSPYDQTLQFRTPRGPRWVQLRSTPQRLPDGTVVREGLALDVTERELAKQRLAASEARFRAISEGAPLGILLTDDRDELLYANPALLGLLGREPAELAGHGWRAWIPGVPAADAPPDAPDEPVLIVRGDGRRLWCRRHTAVVSDGSDRPGRVTLLTDVTAERAVAEALADDRGRLHQVLGAIAERVWDWDLRTDTVEVSTDLLGLGPTANHPRWAFGNWSERIHPQDRAGTLAALEDHLHGRTPVYRAEYRLRLPDGRWVWYLDGGRVVERAADGRPLRVIGAMQDIQDRKQAEAALAEAELRLDLAVRGSNVGIWDWDIARQSMYRSDALKAQLGYAPHEWDDRLDPWFQAMHPEDRARNAAQVQDLLEGRTTVLESEDRVRHRDGTYRRILSRGQLVRDAAGRPVRMVGVQIDLTDLRDAEEGLRESIRFTSSLLDSVEEAIVVVNETGQILSHNDRWSRLTPVGQPLSVGDNLLAACDQAPAAAEAPAVLARGLRAVLARGRPQVQAEFADGPGPEARWHLARVVPFRGEGPRRAVVVLVEITEQKRAALAIEQARRAAERSDQAKGQFLANMSHELRTPLIGLIGLVDLVGEAAIPAAAAETLDAARRNAAALMSLLDGILEMAKLEAGKVEPQRLAFDLGTLVADITGLFAHQARQQGLELSCHVPPEVPPVLVGDPMRIRQVLANLVGNAVKFTPAGRVTVDLHLLTRPPGQGRPGIRLEVRDTGIGIAPESQEAIFESFTQVDGHTARRYEGAGLGLAICRELVGLMGGRLGLESRPGVGSCFWFELTLDEPPPAGAGPSAPAPATEPIPPAALAAPAGAAAVPTPGPARPHRGPTGTEPSPALAGLRVLVVDDNAVNRRVMLHLLDRLGCQATAVVDGWQAVQATEADGFDAILMDVQMPTLDGLVATALIRDREQTAGRPRRPILAVSAHTFESNRRQCLAAGMDDHLPRPVSPARLAEALTAWAVRRPGTAATVAPGQDDPVQRRLDELCGPDPGLRRPIVREFRESVERALAAGAAALARHDPAALAGELHGMQGMCLTLGAGGLAALARYLERAALADDRATLTRLWPLFHDVTEDQARRLLEPTAPLPSA